MYSTGLLKGFKAAQKPDMTNHSLIHFLDKFVYRNAKTSDKQKGSSIMQPTLAAAGGASVLVPGKTSAHAAVQVNNAAFWKQKADNVAAEDVFFHRYFNVVGKPAQEERKKARKEKAREDDDEVDGEEGAEGSAASDEDEIWDALVSSKPEVGENEEMDGFSDEEDEDADIAADYTDDEDDEGVDIEAGLLDDESMHDSEEMDSDNGEPEDIPRSDPKDWRERRERKKKLKALPTFASAEDYAEMLGQDEYE
jgi:ribosome biogenesis protein MAK21